RRTGLTYHLAQYPQGIIQDFLFDPHFFSSLSLHFLVITVSFLPILRVKNKTPGSQTTVGAFLEP
ncbi:hypothetical protein KH017_19675, partial [bacterium]|nr:hypothetical protein [bacterium]